MFNAQKLFKERLSAHLKEMSRYLRYIFNGHMAIAMIFIISVLAIYYQQWLTQLSADFPASAIIGIAFGLIVSYNPIRTLLKEPDLVFLMVAEQKMKTYFRNSLIYSFLVHIYIVLIVFAALGPLYFHMFPDRPVKSYLLTLVVILFFKVANLISNWGMLKVRNQRIRVIDQFIRFLLNSAVFYFIVSGEFLFASLMTSLFFLYFINDLFLARKQAGIVWDVLLEKDLQRMQFFYRFASMFAEVPHIKKRVKKRRLLTNFINKKIPFQTACTFDYLYRLTFVRSGDYLGMYVRLTVIGGLIIFIVPNVWLKITFALLFLYMSNFQLMTLYHHHRTNMWLDIYPVSKNERLRAFMTFLWRLTSVQAVLFSLIFLFWLDIFSLVVVVIVGILFSYLFNYKYVKQKLTKNTLHGK